MNGLLTTNCLRGMPRWRILTINEACKRYRLSIDEYRAWERDFDARGEPGLRSTRVGLYRKPPRVP